MRTVEVGLLPRYLVSAFEHFGIAYVMNLDHFILLLLLSMVFKSVGMILKDERRHPSPTWLLVSRLSLRRRRVFVTLLLQQDR